MLQTLLAAAIAPLLTAASTLAARRWGARIGGVVGAFPAIVGPVLLLTTIQHGSRFAAGAAEGTLLGLVGLAAFALAYASAAARLWPSGTCVAAGWAAAVLASAAAGALGGSVGAPVGLLAASIALFVAYRALPNVPAPPAARRETSIPARMALTALLVLTLAVAAGALGPLAGGILAALPVLASILAVLTHRDAGPVAAVALLRGMLAGMGGFVVFCEAIALLVVPAPLWMAFALATAGALLAQAPAVAVGRVGERVSDTGS